MPTIDYRSQQAQQRWVECFNDGSQEIPAYGAIEITGATNPEGGGRVALTGQRPTADSIAGAALNGYLAIPVGAYGLCTLDGPTFALFDSGSPAFGTRWGTKAGQFELTAGNTGFRVIGLAADGKVLVERLTIDTTPFAFQLTNEANQLIENGDPSQTLNFNAIEIDTPTASPINAWDFAGGVVTANFNGLVHFYWNAYCVESGVTASRGVTTHSDLEQDPLGVGSFAMVDAGRLEISWFHGTVSQQDDMSGHHGKTLLVTKTDKFRIQIDLGETGENAIWNGTGSGPGIGCSFGAFALYPPSLTW